MTPTAADMRELPELPTPGRVVEVRGSTWANVFMVSPGTPGGVSGGCRW